MKINLRKSIEWLLASYLFLLPLGTIWIFKFGKLNGSDWQYGTMGIYGTEILLWLILILALSCRWHSLLTPTLSSERRGGNFPRPLGEGVRRTGEGNPFPFLSKERGSFWPMILLSGFLIWSLLSVIWSSYHTLALYDWLKLLEVISLVFILINFSAWRKNFIALSLAGGLQAILAVAQFASQRVVANKWLGIASHAVFPLGDAVTETPVGRFLRSYGAFPHPNIFGGFMAIAFFATLFWLKSAKGYWKFIGWFLLVLNFLGLFLSFSRSAWIGFALAFIFWLALNLKKKETRLEAAKIGFIILIFAGILSANFWPILDTRISASGRLEQKSNQGRITLLVESERVIKNHWFLGVGLGNYTYYAYQQDPSRWTINYQPVHNVFLLIWSELGIVGFIIFSILFICSFILALKGYRRNWINPALFLIVAVVSLVDHYFWSNYTGSVFLWGLLIFNLIFNNRNCHEQIS